MNNRVKTKLLVLWSHIHWKDGESETKKLVKAYEITKDAYFSVDSHRRKCKHLEMSLRLE